VLLRLAKSPPPDAASLADVPGVGAAVTERLGGAILRALSCAGPDQDSRSNDPAFSALEKWRAGVAREMGVPVYAIVSDAVLRAISEAQPKSRSELARIRGLGPRALAKFGDDLLRLIAGDNEPLRRDLIEALVPE
jgi:ribonuclease D